MQCGFYIDDLIDGCVKDRRTFCEPIPPGCDHLQRKQVQIDGELGVQLLELLEFWHGDIVLFDNSQAFVAQLTELAEQLHCIIDGLTGLFYLFRDSLFHRCFIIL